MYTTTAIKFKNVVITSSWSSNQMQPYLYKLRIEYNKASMSGGALNPLVLHLMVTQK